jgi:hypothetical protein
MLSGAGGAVFGTINGSRSTDPLGLFGVSGRTLTIPADVQGKLQVIHNILTNPNTVGLSNHQVTSIMTYDNTVDTPYEYARNYGFAGTNSPALQYSGINNIGIFPSVDVGHVISFNVYSSVTNTPVVYETISYILWRE